MSATRRLRKLFHLLLDHFAAKNSDVKVVAREIRDFRSAKGLAMVQNRCLCGFDTKSEAFA
jgi:hypothetical protein